MSDIWGLSDGSDAKDTGGEYEIPGGGNFDPLPDGSKVLAMVEDAEWKEDGDRNEFLSLTWTVVKPEEFGNRKIFQKLWIKDFDPRAKDDKQEAKRDKARRMFAAIDANAGGKLAKKGGTPSSEDIAMALANKLMVIRLGLWEMEDREDRSKTISGNWVSMVAPRNTEIGVPDAPVKKTPAKSQASSRRELDESEIPF